MPELTKEQRQAIAIASARKKQSEQPGSFSRFAAGTSVGVSRTLGFPVDVVNAILGAFGGGHEEPLGGSRNIQKTLSRFGMSVPPGDEEELGMAGRVGEVVGAGATGATGVVRAGVRSAARSSVPGAQRPGVLRGVAEDVAESAVSKPVRFMAGEATAAAAAGVASFEAAQRFPDSQGAQAMAEIVGGFTPAGAVASLKIGTRTAVGLVERLPLLGPAVARNARQLIAGLTMRGGRRRASERIRRSVSNPDDARGNLGRRDVLREAPLTPAQKTGEEGLLALERSVMEATPELSSARQKQFAEVNRTIRDAIEAPSRDVPTHQVKEYFQGLLDARLHIAARRADERLAELGQNATREDLNRIAREELLSARRAAREQESQLHEAIPRSAELPTVAGQDAYEGIRLSLSSAQKEDIPAAAKRFLDPDSKKFLGDVTTISEVRGLQGKLREEARIARADNKLNKARIADEIADALNEDIGNAIGGPEVREAVDVAVAFSRDLNDRFTRGAVGRLLGTDKTGGVSVPEGLTLEVTVGQRGPRAREATDALLEAVRRNGDEAAMRGHIEGFLLDDFRRAAVRNGQVDPNAAERYFRENQDVLSRFPEARRVMERARVSSTELQAAERMADPKVSRAAVFINAPPGQEIERVIATSRPRQAMEELVSLARQDPTGRAEEGLKAAFMNMLLRRSEMTGTLDVSDTPFVSGARLTRELDDPQVLEAARGLFNRSEMARIARIRQTALLLDRARGASQAAEGVIGDMPGTVTSMLGRILSAQMGRVIAGKTGGGTVQTPGIMASQAQKLLRAGVQDPARRLLNDAVQDESLFLSLLLPMDTQARRTAVRGRLNAWVVDVLSEQHEIDEDDE